MPHLFPHCFEKNILNEIKGIPDALVCLPAGAKQHIDKQDGNSIRNN